jgi:hypothetical protein
MSMFYPVNRADLPACFEQDSVRRGVEADVKVVAALNEQIKSLDRYLIQHARVDDPLAYQQLQTIPGVGEVLSLVMLYEIQDVSRFANASAVAFGIASGFFARYSRIACALVTPDFVFFGIGCPLVDCCRCTSGQAVRDNLKSPVV